MDANLKMLLLFVDETDRHGDLPAYEAVIRKLLQLEISGATATVGIMGYGAHHRVHHKRLLGVSDDRPVTVAAIDREAKLREAVPHLRRIAPDATIVLVDAEALP